ncbi:KASH5 protein, partial [Oceanites oceanicus]|nr:KASH5 protein [Oceanites oceanicus]
VTGQSVEEGQLRALRRMLDPEAAGAALDLPTFHAVMREWIASCRQEGSHRNRGAGCAPNPPCARPAAEEGHTAPAAAQLDGGNADMASATEAASLRSRAEQLAARNAKLQRDAESAEELNARLAEEVAQLKAQLRCSQQALERARGAAEELEDVKMVAKTLEEENGEIRWQLRQLNQRLVAEGRGVRERIQALAAETANLEAQLCRCTALLSSRDAALAQAAQRVEELTAALAEYGGVTQELRREVTRLRDQLGRMQDAWA